MIQNKKVIQAHCHCYHFRLYTTSGISLGYRVALFACSYV